jgi:diguanylate cyclase
VADKLAAAVAEPLDLDGQVVKLTASIGIAVFPEDGEDLDTLVACADTAMYASKRAHHGLPATPAPLPVVARPAQKAADELSLSQRLADLRNANERLILSALDARRLAEAAEQARQRQSALLAAVANELRDPMAPIRIATAMLGRPFADEPLLPRVEQIVALQMRQMSDLMEAVMAAGAVGANGEPASPSGLQLRRQPVELGQIIDAAVADLGPLTEARHQQVEWQRPSVPVDVLGDAPALEQLVVNLLDNASRHTPAGGVIGVNLAQGDGHVDVTVSDEGIGLTPTILPIIFEPFVQDGRTLGTGGIGLGVGLTVAKALAHALGGDIAARSAGAGSRSSKRWHCRWARCSTKPAAPLSHVYFPTTAIVSLLYVMQDGASAEIAVVGHEGIVGVALFMGGESTPSRAVVQSAGHGLRLQAKLLKEEFESSPR